MKRYQQTYPQLGIKRKVSKMIFSIEYFRAKLKEAHNLASEALDEMLKPSNSLVVEAKLDALLKITEDLSAKLDVKNGTIR